MRNHDVVPRCADTEVLDWEFTVEGIVDSPIDLSMRSSLANLSKELIPSRSLVLGTGEKRKNRTED